MLRALAIKELRESAGLAALAVLAMASVLAMEMQLPMVPWSNPAYRYTIPFVGDGFYSSFAMVAAGLAIILGLKQSAWESILGGTYAFLLHRPVPRNRIFAVKMSVGIALLLVLTGLPVLIYGVWAAAPGNTPTSFDWSMTRPSWSLWITMSALYLAAFLCGIRPGRWFGTRLVPLAGGGVAIVAIVWILGMRWWWIAGLGLLALLYLGIIAGIVHFVQTRDY